MVWLPESLTTSEKVMLCAFSRVLKTAAMKSPSKSPALSVSMRPSTGRPSILEMIWPMVVKPSFLICHRDDQLRLGVGVIAHFPVNRSPQLIPPVGKAGAAENLDLSLLDVGPHRQVVEEGAAIEYSANSGDADLPGGWLPPRIVDDDLL